MIKNYFCVFFTLVLMLPLSLSLSSCSDDDDDKNGGGVSLTQGTWVHEDYRYGEELTLEFDDDGEFYGDYRDDDTTYSFSGEYKQSGSSIKIRITYCSSSNPYVEFQRGTVMTATLNGDVMTLVVDDDRYTLYLDIDDYDDDDDWDY